LDEEQQRIAEDLSGVFEGELRFDEVAREIYSTDASLYQIHPLGVVCPRHSEDVVALAQYASEFDIPLIARGAGSGVAGGALGRGLIVDFSRFMRNIEQIDAETVRVQAGVVRDQLNRELRPHGRYFPPDPSNTAVTTVGGMLAVDAAGSHAVRVGSTRDHVVSISVVLADGSRFEAGQYADPMHVDRPGREQEIVTRITHLIRSNEDLIRERQPALIRNCSGYHLRTVLEGDLLSLPRLLVGSEGTLGLFTEATLHTTPLPGHRGVALLLFGDVSRAVESVQNIIPLEPSACDLLDRRLLSLAREADARFEAIIPRHAEAAILVEQIGYADQQVRDRLRDTIAVVQEGDPSVMVARETNDPDEVEFLWSLPSRVVPLLIRLRGETRPVPIVEDIAVPPEALNEFLIKAHRMFQKHWVTASLYAHAASGQVHFRPFLGTPTRETAGEVESLARDLYEVALAHGGTVSGEHGNGLARTAFIRSQYGPLYRVFQQVKELFDPHNLLNPGKIISDDAHLTVRDLRTAPASRNGQPEIVPLQLNWTPEEFEEAAQRCNGCGDCRVESAPLRMCPFFHQRHSEDASPRSKANLMKALAAGTLDPKTFSTDEAKLLADNCFNCKQCVLECPAGVDIPSLAIEAKAQCVSANGLSRGDWILSRAHSFGELGCTLSPFTNWAIGNPWMRWVMEQAMGISRQRRLPRFARRPFLKSLRPNVLSEDPGGGGIRIVYFVDHFVNYHDPELGTAFVRILEHHGIPVIIPREQVASGMAMISAGDLDAARDVAETNVRVLAEYARDGCLIVCTEPTAAVCLKDEYPRLLDHPDVEVIAGQVREAGAFLQSLHQRGELDTDFPERPPSSTGAEYQFAYHTPCHLRFLSPMRPLLELVELIPGLSVRRIDAGCSGMAGAFGLTDRNFEQSMAIGAPLTAALQEEGLDAGLTECSSCRMQMEQQTLVPTLHPLKLLAWAYGLMPEMESKLTPQRNRLTSTP
jgi:FAD/FMN-containing dehydrogenase/Fe-S oxidoreductase